MPSSDGEDEFDEGLRDLVPRGYIKADCVMAAGRAAGPVFISHRRPAPSRRPPARDLCPDTGKARLGYDRAASGRDLSP